MSFRSRADGSAYPLTGGQGVNPGAFNAVAGQDAARAAAVARFSQIVGDDDNEITVNKETRALTKMLRDAGFDSIIPESRHVVVRINKNPKAIRDAVGGNSLMIEKGNRWIAQIAYKDGKLGLRRMDGVDSEIKIVSEIAKKYFGL